ncbi:MAG: fructose-1,6-bisphosphatase [Lachnospiraceae bacterium]
MNKEELRYLRRLAELYPNIAKASTEIINLQSILNLPKGTEHFLSDIHGEYEAFSHVLRNGSGAVRKKIDDVFGHTLTTADKQSLCTLIYYPKERMDLVEKTEKDMHNWYKIMLYRLIEVCKTVASKYTRSKVRKALPKDYAYVIEELITEKSEVLDKGAYYDAIIDTIIQIARAENFIIALAELIQRLVIDHLHIIGDIYDRGPGPHFIMDRLTQYHSLDIQWGNHDVVWMGAASGQAACIATIIRISARYSNLDILEDGYGINLLPLATFALNTYKDDPCTCFKIRGHNSANEAETQLTMKMHKAISVIQFKLEGQLILRRPEFNMQERLLLDKIDYVNGTMELSGHQYKLLDTHLPTVDPEHPYELTEEERDVIERLQSAFENCERLQNHIHLLLNKGSLYKVQNGNLLYHGCIPLNKDGSFEDLDVFGQFYHGKKLYDVLESYVRKGFFALDEEERRKGQDIMWYIWCGSDSPLFGKDKMATFERYFLQEKETHVEKKNPYYDIMREEVADSILAEFGLEGESIHIINGHVPVHHGQGENPIKCNGKLLVIDGGFSKAYQHETGIAGYTLIYNSYGLLLTAHEPFVSTEQAIEEEVDINSKRVAVELSGSRRLVGDTDTGCELRERIEELERLLIAFREGRIIEK